MNPGLVVKLRPSGPWRIGPDSGARNRVDVIYHSDSLYSAITSAMARLGWLEEWLDATARTGASAVAFASCFPYMDDLGFVVPPRTVWPPASPSAKSARVRWKSARFVPLKVVQSILAGKRLDENQWTVDGPSDCLVPNGRPGPFRTAVRWSAGVDRLTGMTERHSTACIEFRPGSGLWTVVSFADETAHARWADPVKAAFRLLADSGFGGERSRGWGRSEAPEFTDGMLPELILPLPKPETTAVEPSVRAATIRERSQRAAMRQTAKVTPAPVESEASAAAAAPAEAVTPPTEEVPGVAETGASEAAPTALEAAPEAPAPVEEISPAPLVEASEPEPSPVETAPEASAPAEAVSVAPQAETSEPEPPAVETAPEASMPSEETSPAPTAEASEPEPPAVETAPEASAPSEEISPAPTAEASEPEPPAAETAPEASAPSEEISPAPTAEASEPEPPAVETAPEASAPSEEISPAPTAEASEPKPPAVEAAPEASAPVEELPATPEAEASTPEAEPEAPAATAPAIEPEPETEPTSPPLEMVEAAPEPEPEAPVVEAGSPTHPHWLLSVFTPAAADTVDWRRGNYTVMARGGRVESPAGSGGLKKQIQMVAEGSVIYTETAPRGSAADVAPDGFAHPVFRSGFALAIPLPEVS